VRLLGVDGAAPEDVVVDGAGRVVTGVDDGRLLRVGGGGRVEPLADTGGRPLGVELLGDGRLLVCDARRGLLAVDAATGAVEVLVDRVAGAPLRFCNNAAVATDGTVYFSDSSRRFGIDHWRADLLEHSGTGRLLRRDPDGAVEVLLEGLQFANGVALAPDESFVAVAETGAYRLTRLWLTGGGAGRTDVLVDNLPGFPDNLSCGPTGLIWIALGSPRVPLLDRLHRLHPAVRRGVWALPERLQPKPVRTLWVQAVDAGGALVHDLQGPGDRYAMVTGVREHQGRLYLGSLAERAVAVLDLPA
jgi:sugar lactone lactonase YvrE